MFYIYLLHRDSFLLTNHTCLKVVTDRQKTQVLEGYHSSELGGGHFGRDKTLAKVSERYYWLGMVHDVKNFCKTCDKCQRANRYILIPKFYLCSINFHAYIYAESLTTTQ